MNFKHLACLAALSLFAVPLIADIVYPAEREERDFDTNAAEKLDRGIQNLIMWPMEISEGLYHESERDIYQNRGFGKGTADGIRNAAVRFGQGVFDTFTFPLNTGNFELPWNPPPDVLHPEWVPVVNWLIPSHFDEYVDKSFEYWYEDKYEVWQAP